MPNATTERDPALQEFVDAACAAFAAAVTETASKASIARIFDALETVAPPTDAPGQSLLTCGHLATVAAPENFARPDLRRLAKAFAALYPRLRWYRRPTLGPTASPNCAEGHANAMLFGPGGLETREDLWVGVSLLAPHVRYPDHDHPPEETYLVMSDGEFSHGGSPWFRPGIGGSFYNTPGILHAMRSGETPLLAFWALWPEAA